MPKIEKRFVFFLGGGGGGGTPRYNPGLIINIFIHYFQILHNTARDCRHQ